MAATEYTFKWYADTEILDAMIRNIMGPMVDAYPETEREKIEEVHKFLRARLRSAAAVDLSEKKGDEEREKEKKRVLKKLDSFEA